MAGSYDDLVEQLPYYLSVERKKGLLRELEAFQNHGAVNYYTSYCSGDWLQGDCWSGFPVIDLETAEKKNIKGVIFSNSCDISLENARDFPPNVVFSPLIPLRMIADQLAATGAHESAVSSKIEAIKKQMVTNIFYLPAWCDSAEDQVILLDNLHSVDVDTVTPALGGKIFTLSMIGFYLFVFKLSVHFCRFHEGVDRDGSGN